MSGDNLTPRLSLDCPSPIPPYCRIIITFIPIHESEKETSNLSMRSRPTTDITVNFHAVLSKIPSFCSVFLSINHFGLFALSFAEVWSYLLALLVCGHYYTASRATFTRGSDSYFYNDWCKGKWIDHTLTCLALRFIVHLTSSATWYYELNTNLQCRPFLYAPTFSEYSQRRSNVRAFFFFFLFFLRTFDLSRPRIFRKHSLEETLLCLRLRTSHILIN